MPIDWHERARGVSLRVRNFVDGRFQDPAGDRLIETAGPRDGKMLCRFGSGRQGDVEAAVGIARKAFNYGRWSRIGADRWREILLRLVGLIEEHRDELALLEFKIDKIVYIKCRSFKYGELR